MVKNSGNDEWGYTAMQPGEVNLPGPGRSDPVHYRKTAAVIHVLLQQHFQVHQGRKDKPNSHSA